MSAERPKILSAKDVPYWREQSPPLAESYPVLLLLDCCDCQLGGAAERSEPRSLALFEFAQDTAFEINYGYDPFVLVL